MRYMDFYAGKKVLVTGGAGSIGSVIVRRLIEAEAWVTVLSRDETKHAELQRDNPKVGCIVGDVRDLDTVRRAAGDKNIVIHAAAMKHVDRCNLYPEEAIRTNLLGAMNVQVAVAQSNVDTVIVVSTDKAANPFGVMGLTKKLQEQLFLNGYNGSSKVKITRFGNVMGTRGSVAPLFKKLLDEGKKIPVTDSTMHRFFMTPQQAAELVLFAGCWSSDRSITIREMKHASIGTLAAALGATKEMIESMPLRPGEKKEEQLLDDDEMTRTLVYPFLESRIGIIHSVSIGGQEDVKKVKGIFSPTSGGMVIDEMKKMLIESGVMT